MKSATKREDGLLRRRPRVARSARSGRRCMTATTLDHGERLLLVVRDVDRREPSVCWRRLQLEAHLARSFASRLESGSSSSSSGGSVTSARASARRCCWPPERSVAGRLPRPPSRTSSSTRSTRFANLRPPGPPAARSDRERKGDVVEHGHVRPDRVRLEDHAEAALVGRHADARDPAEKSVRPPTTISPLSGASRPAMQRRIVVLPQPGRAEEREELTLAHRERHVVDCDARRRTSSPLPATNVFVEALDAEEGRRSQLPDAERPADAVGHADQRAERRRPSSRRAPPAR